MATITAAAGGGSWTVGATWVGGVAPTAADDALLANTSGNVTIDTGAVCRSLDCNTYTGTLTHTAAVTLTIGDATAGAGSIALRLVAGMTYTLGSATTSAINFISTSTTQQTITTGGKTLGNWTVNGAGSSYLLSDANTVGSTATVTLTAGTLNTNGQSCSWGLFSSSNSNTRTLTLGASVITMTGAGNLVIDFTTSTNLTFNCDTSTITVNNNGTAVINPGSTGSTFIFNNLVFTGVGSGSIARFFTCTALTVTGPATKTGTFLFRDSTTSIIGTLIINGNSTTNRLLVTSRATGTAGGISASTVSSISNVDFMDITGAGVAAPFTGTSLGDCQGNSGITFDTPVTQTRSGAGGNWSTAGNWTSRVPLPQDDAVVGAAASGTISMDMSRLGKSVDFTGFAGALTYAVTGTSYGNWTFGSGMTITNSPHTFAGRSTQTITSNGRSFVGTMTFNSPNGTYTLQDAITTTLNTMTIAFGSFNANNQNVNVPAFTATTTSTITMGSGTWSLTTANTGPLWSVSAGTTVTAGTSTIVFTTASANLRTFAGNGKTYYTLTYNVANSPGALAITGANTFNTLNVGSGRILTMPSSTTNTMNSGGTFNVNGANNGYLYLPGVASNYASTPDSAALSITGDIDIKLRLAMDDWTPAALQVLFTKLYTSGQYAYDLFMNTNGILTFRWSTNGISGGLVSVNSLAVGLADGVASWIRATRNATTGDVKYYTSTTDTNNPSLVSWTQLGTTTTAATGNMFDGTDQLVVGGQPTQFPTAAKFYRTIVSNGYDGAGSVVFDADFTTKAFGANSFTESSTNAATVTINGTLAQAGDGRVSLNSSTPGVAGTLSRSSGTVNTVNYLSIQDSTASGGASWFAGANSMNVSGNSGWIFAATPTDSSKGFMMFFE